MVCPAVWVATALQITASSTWSEGPGLCLFTQRSLHLTAMIGVVLLVSDFPVLFILPPIMLKVV